MIEQVRALISRHVASHGAYATKLLMDPATSIVFRDYLVERIPMQYRPEMGAPITKFLGLTVEIVNDPEQLKVA